MEVVLVLGWLVSLVQAAPGGAFGPSRLHAWGWRELERRDVKWGSRRCDRAGTGAWERHIPPPVPVLVASTVPSQAHGRSWRTASVAAASLPSGDIPLWSCSPSFLTGVPNGIVSQHPPERWPCSMGPSALARQCPCPPLPAPAALPAAARFLP